MKFYGNQVRFALYMEQSKAEILRQLSANNGYRSVNKFLNDLIDVALIADQDKYVVRCHFHRSDDSTLFLCTDRNCTSTMIMEDTTNTDNTITTNTEGEGTSSKITTNTDSVVESKDSISDVTVDLSQTLSVGAQDSTFTLL